MMGTFTVLTKSLTFKTPFNREKNGFSIYAVLITCIIYCNTFCTKLLTLENVSKKNSHIYIYYIYFCIYLKHALNLVFNLDYKNIRSSHFALMKVSN